ncbi:Ger(x)C family spore germination protein [Pseudalkalibacillus sp. R45]|uniref:Ger(x)C family spore germination protein n=1 Tax=Pseudalkalibacillus sp. R45 TaxID=3457433 RepID=UPI003FCCC0C2
MRRRQGLLLIICLLFLPGCWDVRELDELGITLALGLDMAGEEFKVSVQVVNPEEISTQSGGGGSRKPVIVYEETGETLTEALRKILRSSPREIYLSHIRMLVIGEELAKESMKYVLDFVSRNHEFRTDFFIIVTKETEAETVLKVFTPSEPAPANKMYKSLLKSEELFAPTKAVTLDILKSDLLSKGKQPVLSGIELIGNIEKAGTEQNVKDLTDIGNLIFDDLAVFQDDKLIGWLNEEESKGYNYLTDHVNKANGVINCPGEGKIGMNLIRTSTNIKSEFKGETPVISVFVKGEGNIDEVNCKYDITKQDNILKLEQEWNKVITSSMEKSVQTVQEEFAVDIFGFGEVVNRQHPRKWKSLKENWDETFKELEVNIDVNLKIRRIGTVGDTIVNELE